MQFVTGMMAIGNLARTGVFRQRKDASCISMDEFLVGADQFVDVVEAGYHRPDSDTQLWAAAMQDQEKGLADTPRTRQQMNERWGVGGWRPVPTFDLVQPSGKHRMISDAKRGGQNEASAASEKLDIVTPFHPLLHCKAFAQAASRLKVPSSALQLLQMLSGGEDMPDAYKWCPILPDHWRVNVQALFDVERRCWVYQEVWGNLFGYINAVLNFNRIPKFMQALARRWLAILLAMYFDDASIQDLSSGEGTAQSSIQETIPKEAHTAGTVPRIGRSGAQFRKLFPVWHCPSGATETVRG
jgi:hypothetical protein